MNNISIAFYYSPHLRDFWDQLIRSFSINNAYEIGAPLNVEMGGWSRIDDIKDLPTENRIFFSPKTSKYFPGTIELSNFVHLESGLYIFGSDDHHNKPIVCDNVVYIDMPKENKPMWSAQTAAIVLYDQWRRNGDSR